MKYAIVAVVMLVSGVVVGAQSLNDVCLVDDLETLASQGLLIDTSLAVDSVRVVGGTCDSVSARLYLTGTAFPIPMSVKKLDTCSMQITVFGGLIDSTINVCAILSVERVARSFSAAGVPGRAVKTLTVSGGVFGGQVYDVRGRLVASKAPVSAGVRIDTGVR